MSTCTERLLRVDLTAGRTMVEEIPAEVRRAFIGGRGLGIKYLYDELKPGTDPLGPANKLIFSTGVLAGTAAHGFSRWIVMTKSPAGGTVTRAVGGGGFGAHLKFAGYDLLVVEGEAPRPVYLYLEKERAELLPADDLWGLDTVETQSRLVARHGHGTQVACIGPAGEKLVRYAIIIAGRRSASRGGVGTVMGSKKLKAVVVRASGQLEASQPERFRQLAKEQAEILRQHPRRRQLHQHGTIFMVETALKMGWFPVKNFREGSLPGLEALLATEYAKLKVKNGGCYGCMTRCGQVHFVPDGRWAGATNEGPEYESIWAFSGQVGATDIGFTIAADALCDALGLDTISTGNCLGFACELYERGLLSPQELDGLDLSWGNCEALLALIKKIAVREGLGDFLANGVQQAAEAMGRGADQYAMHCKGLELPAYEPRAVKGYGLSYATSNIGGSHMYGRPRHELYGGNDPRPIDRFADTGRGDLIALVQLQQAGDETAIVCNFGNSGLTPELLGQLLVAASGIEEFGDVRYRELVGERIVCLERAFNVREGMDRKDDTLPARMLTEPLANAGPATGQVIRKLDVMLDEYYDALGYTRAGIPGEAKIKELGLDWLAPDLAKRW